MLGKYSDEQSESDMTQLYLFGKTQRNIWHNSRDIKKVARRLGHNDSVDNYIGICDDLKTQIGRKSNLFDQALRQFKKGRK